jgi:hypothetical protein
MAACPRRHSAATPLPRASIIGRRSPASSSFVLAAARLRALQLDPGHAAAANQAAIGESPRKDKPQPGNHTPGHQARPTCPLTAKAPMGAVRCCCTAHAPSAKTLAAVLAGQPSAFRPGRTPDAYARLPLEFVP